MALNFDNVDSTTIIAAGLGFFFIIVAMFKTFGRKNSSKMYIPGSQKPQKEDEEVKLSDPFSSTQASTIEPEKAESTGMYPTSRMAGKSAFKQFAPDSAVAADDKVRDDSDYQWE